MGEYQHRSGALKQKNKKHKGVKLNPNGRVERLQKNQRKSIKLNQNDGKNERLHRQKQLRDSKKKLLVNRNRIGALKGPPRIVGLVPLSEDADLHIVEKMFEGCCISTELGELKHIVYSHEKKKCIMYKCEKSILSVLDIAKVSDILVFVLPISHGAGICVDGFGQSILTSLRSQGLPTCMGVTQGIDTLPVKQQAESKKVVREFFEAEFGTQIKIADGTNGVQMQRTLAMLQPRSSSWRDARSYLLATHSAFQVSECSDEGTLRVTGYVRGAPISVNQLVHIPDVGTYQLDRILSATDDSNHEMDDESVLALPEASKQQDLKYEAQVDPFACEQTWPTEEELLEAEINLNTTPKNIPSGMSEYQASWMPCDEDGNILVDTVSEDSLDFDKSEGNVENDQEDDDDMYLDEGIEKRKQFYDEYQQRKHAEKDDLAFPDEVEIPTDSDARVRLGRYRGLKSFRTSPWDPKESLPLDYSRLHQFENFSLTQKNVLAQSCAMKAMLSSTTVDQRLDCDGYVATDSYVTLVIRNVPKSMFESRNQSTPLIVSSVLQHENRMSVLNFSIQRNSNFSETVKSKDKLVFQCGFQRIEALPIFSDQNLNCDKNKFLRFMPLKGWCVASIYGPSMFQPAPVLVFQKSTDGHYTLVATGNLQSVNPNRIVLKRIVITGVPVKVKRRKAVVRYMFHNPEDVRWFKRIELTSKHGLTGHIKESLGTHGDFKAIFNKPIQQHDTVCMYLYKRVYPKI